MGGEFTQSNQNGIPLVLTHGHPLVLTHGQTKLAGRFHGFALLMHSMGGPLLYESPDMNLDSSDKA